MTRMYCDRCGVRIDNFDQTEITITSYDGEGDIDSTTELELCPDCIPIVEKAIEALPGVEQ